MQISIYPTSRRLRVFDGGGPSQRYHQFLAANDKTNLTPDALSKRKTFFGLVVAVR